MKLRHLISIAALFCFNCLALAFSDSTVVLLVAVGGANLAGYIEGSLR